VSTIKAGATTLKASATHLANTYSDIQPGETPKFSNYQHYMTNYKYTPENQ